MAAAFALVVVVVVAAVAAVAAAAAVAVAVAAAVAVAVAAVASAAVAAVAVAVAAAVAVAVAVAAAVVAAVVAEGQLLLRLSLGYFFRRVPDHASWQPLHPRRNFPMQSGRSGTRWPMIRSSGGGIVGAPRNCESKG